MSPDKAVNRVLLRVSVLVAIDSDESIDTISENFYARLSELVQSEDHMLDALVEGFDLPGNPPATGEAIIA